MALGDDIVELYGAKTVTCRVYDFLLEIIPRKRRLMLSIQIWITRTVTILRSVPRTQRSGLLSSTPPRAAAFLFNLRDSSQFGAAIHIARQAYEKVSE